MKPVDLAEKIPVSHMTIYRWLKKEDKTTLPVRRSRSVGAVRSVAQLRAFLEEREMSPRDFATKTGVGLSHMTVYRWLRKSSSYRLPKKYHLAIDRFTSMPKGVRGSAGDLPWYQDQSVLARLSSLKSASEPGASKLIGLLESDGKECADTAKLKSDVRLKLQDRQVGKKLREQVRSLLKGLFSNDLSKRSRWVIIGALLYFLSPIDLIPDTIPVLGYVDDLAVLALAADYIAKNQSKMKQSAEAPWDSAPNRGM